MSASSVTFVDDHNTPSRQLTSFDFQVTPPANVGLNSTCLLPMAHSVQMTSDEKARQFLAELADVAEASTMAAFGDDPVDDLTVDDSALLTVDDSALLTVDDSALLTDAPNAASDDAYVNAKKKLKGLSNDQLRKLKRDADVVSHSSLSSDSDESFLTCEEDSVNSELEGMGTLADDSAPKSDRTTNQVPVGMSQPKATAEELADVAAIKLRYPNASPFYLCDGTCGRVTAKGGIHSFKCIVEDRELGQKGGYIEVLRSEKGGADARLNRLLDLWLRRHGLYWCSYPKNRFQCPNHSSDRRVECQVVVVNGKLSYRCTLRGCQRSYPRKGPIFSNYQSITPREMLCIYIRWAQGVNVPVRGINANTTRKHSRRLEAILATWMVQHSVRIKARQIAIAKKAVADAVDDKAKKEAERMLVDHAEVDETYFSRPKYGKGRMRRTTFILETLVLVNALGETVDFACTPVFKKNWYHLRALISRNIPVWTVPVYTDCLRGYVKVKELHVHKTVNHSKEFVAADGTSTNNIEGFHSLLKKTLRSSGSYANVKNHPRSYHILSHCGLALAKLRAAEYHGQVLVWLFQAIASVVAGGHPVVEDPETDRRAYYIGLAAAAEKDRSLLSPQGDASPPAKTPNRGGRPRGSKNKPKENKAERVAGKKSNRGTEDANDDEAMYELARLTAMRDMCRRYFHVGGGGKFTADARSPSSAGARRDADKLQEEMAPFFASKIAARNAFTRVVNELLLFRHKYPRISGKYEMQTGAILTQDEMMMRCADESDADEEACVTAEEAREIADDEVLRKKERMERKEARAARRMEKEIRRTEREAKKAKKARRDRDEEDQDWETDDEKTPARKKNRGEE